MTSREKETIEALEAARAHLGEHYVAPSRDFRNGTAIGFIYGARWAERRAMAAARREAALRLANWMERRRIAELRARAEAARASRGARRRAS